MPNGKFRLQIPDEDYFRRLINCQDKCPVHTPCGLYTQRIAEGNYEEAYRLARMPNPFVYTCARICAHPCEEACRRGTLDQPIAICALKRAATDHHNLGYGHSLGLRPMPKKGKKVAVIGAGPCGLSCAHDLAIMGYQVTIFEASPQPGGMLYMGVPVYRLPRDIIRCDIDAILNLGVELKLNMAAGKDFAISDLEGMGFDALFIATGATRTRDLKIEGVDADGVLKGVEFLLNANLGFKVELGRKVVVIGGGNVAMDIARTAARGAPPAEREDGFIVAIDVSRTALRRGAREVHIVCLESREEMPAYKWEIDEAEREGIVLNPSLGPKRIIEKDGKAAGLETLKVESVFDKDGRFNPAFYEGSEDIIEADTVILAIGQAPDLSFIKESDGIAISPRGMIQIDKPSLAASKKGLFAGGDVAFGPRLLIDVIKDGRVAAASIHNYLSGMGAKSEGRIMVRKIADHMMPNGYDRIKRHKMPTIPIERRIGIAEVELGFSDREAGEEGLRCLKCQIQTIFDADKCILCGGCVDVCPRYCLRIVRPDEMELTDELKKLFVKEQGISGGAIIKDEERCIRCGLCARRCPVGAITMEEIIFEDQGI